jgi:acyl dehydratase
MKDIDLTTLITPITPITAKPPTFASVQVGDALPTLHIAAVDRASLALFAGASGDHNPIHIDTDFARRSGMPDVFAQGMLGMAWVGRVLTQWAPQSRLRRFDVRFQGITHLGNAMQCSGRVVEKLELAGEPCVRVELQSANQFGQTKIVGDALVALP